MTKTTSGGAKAREPKRPPVFATDVAGAPIVMIHLANHPLPAVMDREDFDAWQTMGLSLAWTLNASGSRKAAYVKAAHPGSEATGNLITPARIIAGAGRHQRVRYLDGDRLNLRRGNLYLCDFLAGRAKGREAAIVAKRRTAV